MPTAPLCPPDPSSRSTPHLDLGVDDRDPPVPPCPGDLFRFPPGSVVVHDADGEILELYMTLASIDSDNANDTGHEAPSARAAPTRSRDGQGMGGLGFLDPTQPLLELELVLRPPVLPSSGETTNPAPSVAVAVPFPKSKPRSGAHRRSAAASKSREALAPAREVVLPVIIQQDLSALKTRKGDTGSVVWRSSLHLGTHILTQSVFPPAPDTDPNSPLTCALLDPDRLRQARVLELGSGTGLLAVLLSPLVKEWTASDLLENLGLVQRNLELNQVPYSGSFGRASHPGDATSKSSTAKSSRKAPPKPVPKTDSPKTPNVRLEEINWVAVSPTRSSIPAIEAYDLILAVDCIYNSALVQPLINTLACYTRPFPLSTDASGPSDPEQRGTVVWVVVELRESGVLQDFLDRWLLDGADEHGEGRWRIVRLSEDAMGRWADGRRGRWVGWVGWRLR